MRNTRLKLQYFRNHLATEVEWAPHVNLITGPNGSGKTNLIDAIHYLCMSRSFVAASDQYVAHQDEKYFMISGDFEGNIRAGFKVGCSYSRGEGKKIFVNDSPLDRLSDLIGMVPVVVLSPEDHKLTAEGPAERRAFLDSFISQISKEYLRNLIEYRRVRKQRNKLLQDFRGPATLLTDYIEPWNEQLVSAGSKIIVKRAEVLKRFSHFLEEQYRSISGLTLQPSLEYQTQCIGEDLETVEAGYRKLLKTHFENELEREQTLFGPHRDEIIFYLGEMELRNFGSQGQHRIFAMALKLAQLFYYSDELDDLPIMLLDDVFGNLDQGKTNSLLQTLLSHPGQTFITSASDKPFKDIPMQNGALNSWFTVADGIVSRRY
jgi:DNA replication and repair protein RecF